MTTDANGEACLAGIASGSYTVTETVPTGYAVTSANPQTGTVVENTTCDDATPVVFTNVPLTNFTVSVDSQIDGGTASTIDCDAAVDPALRGDDRGERRRVAHQEQPPAGHLHLRDHHRPVS